MPHIVIAGRRPAYYCRLCKQPFYEGEERLHAAHVAKCYENHAAEVDELRRQHDPFGPGDPEAEQWMAENRIEVIQGKKRLYPSK